MAFETRKCIICNKAFEVSKKSSQKLCSVQCQKIWQSNRTGTLNPRFASLLHECDYCHKVYYIKPYKLKNQNNFCSNKCRQEWFAKIWSQSDEVRNNSRKRILKQLQNQTMNTQTKPQLITNNILDQCKIRYINEKAYPYYSVDNYLYQYNLIIEVMGDYWHSNPLRYNKNTLNDTQRKIVSKDKRKNTYFKNNEKIQILYLWESDLYNKPYLCKRLIQLYIKNEGILENYNSFNYHIKNNKILLNDIIIIPHFSK